jgi:hypothetical protein
VHSRHRTQRRCFGADPSVVYSRCDGAFYLSTLCYSPSNPSSEVQVWRSTDGGATWTDSLDAATAITNIASDGTIDGSVFYDKELLAIDNNPGSPHYGRVYTTFIKFHMTAPSGRSDYCPVQLSYTDPAGAPHSWTWSHTAVVPDDPGAAGRGPSANQWAMPVVDETGAFDIAYAIEECNTAFDPALFFTRSTNGGAGSPHPCGSKAQVSSWTIPAGRTCCPASTMRGSRSHLARVRSDEGPALVRVPKQHRSRHLRGGHLPSDIGRLRGHVVGHVHRGGDTRR